MSTDNKPSHPPRHTNASTLKFHTTDTEALNSAETVALATQGRSITPDESKRALEIGHAMNTGALPEMSMTPNKLSNSPKP
jgi:hypothetical protein